MCTARSTTFSSNYELLFGSDGSDNEEAAAPPKAASPTASEAALEVKVEAIIATGAKTDTCSDDEEDKHGDDGHVQLSSELNESSDDESRSRCVLCCPAWLAWLLSLFPCRCLTWPHRDSSP